MAVDTTFSALAATQAIGCSYRQLDLWVRNGIVTPSVPAHGSGSRRRFTLADVALARAVRQLMALGAEREQVAAIVAKLKRRPLSQWRGAVLVTSECELLDPATAREPGWLIRLDLCVRQEPRTLAA